MLQNRPQFYKKEILKQLEFHLLKYPEREAKYQQQIDAITSIAETAKQNALSAEADSKLSKTISILSLIVATASVMVDIFLK